MTRANLNTKRQLLADLLEGNSSSLKAFKRQCIQQHSPFRWVVDSRAVGGPITVVDKQGNRVLMSEHDLEQLDPAPSIWIITDHSGGKRIPAIDEDHYLTEGP